MRISGTHDLVAPPARVWAALTEPGTLARTIPGALSLQRVGADEYRVTVEAGVASIRGVYDGLVGLGDLDPPNGYTLRASGSGAPGTIDATCAITLTPTQAHGTRVTYEADAVIGGTVAGVGQRVLAGVAKRTAAQFFTAIDAELSTSPAPGPAGAPGPGMADAPAAPGMAGAPAAPGMAAAPAAPPFGAPAGSVGAGIGAPGTAAAVAGEVFAGRASSAAQGGPLTYLAAAAVGAAIALLGVLVGRRGA